MNEVRYIALGDSYTFCEGVSREQEWTKLFANNVNINFLKSIAYNGWTSETLWKECIKNNSLLNYNPSFCTLMIGVNDWFDGEETDLFQYHFEMICNLVINQCKAKLLVVTIPNYLISPEGQKRTEEIGIINRDEKKRIVDGRTIGDFNNIIISSCKENSIEVIDINQQGISLNWIHEDGFHLSPDGNKNLSQIVSQEYKSRYLNNA